MTQLHPADAADYGRPIQHSNHHHHHHPPPPAPSSAPGSRRPSGAAETESQPQSQSLQPRQPPPSAASRGQERLHVLFEHFDDDADGYWSYPEARRARVFLTGEDLPLDEFRLICGEIGAAVARGWSLADLRALYGTDGAALAADCARVEAEVQLSPLPPPPSQADADADADALHRALQAAPPGGAPVAPAAASEVLGRVATAQRPQERWQALQGAFRRRHASEPHGGSVVRALRRTLDDAAYDDAARRLVAAGVVLPRSGSGGGGGRGGGGGGGVASDVPRTRAETVADVMAAALAGPGPADGAGAVGAAAQVRDAGEWAAVQAAYRSRSQSGSGGGGGGGGGGDLKAALRSSLAPRDGVEVRRVLAENGIDYDANYAAFSPLPQHPQQHQPPPPAPPLQQQHYQQPAAPHLHASPPHPSSHHHLHNADRYSERSGSAFAGGGGGGGSSNGVHHHYQQQQPPPPQQPQPQHEPHLYLPPQRIGGSAGAAYAPAAASAAAVVAALHAALSNGEAAEAVQVLSLVQDAPHWREVAHRYKVANHQSGGGSGGDVLTHLQTTLSPYWLTQARETLSARGVDLYNRVVTFDSPPQVQQWPPPQPQPQPHPHPQPQQQQQRRHTGLNPREVADALYLCLGLGEHGSPTAPVDEGSVLTALGCIGGAADWAAASSAFASRSGSVEAASALRERLSPRGFAAAEDLLRGVGVFLPLPLPLGPSSGAPQQQHTYADALAPAPPAAAAVPPQQQPLVLQSLPAPAPPPAPQVAPWQLDAMESVQPMLRRGGGGGGGVVDAQGFASDDGDDTEDVRLPFDVVELTEFVEAKIGVDASALSIRDLQAGIRDHAEERRHLDAAAASYDLVADSLRSALQYRVAEAVERIKLEQKGQERTLGRHIEALSAASGAPDAAYLHGYVPAAPRHTSPQRATSTLAADASAAPRLRLQRRTQQREAAALPRQPIQLDIDDVHTKLEETLRRDYSQRGVEALRACLSVWGEERKSLAHLLVRHAAVGDQLKDTLRYKLRAEGERLQMDNRGRQQQREKQLTQLESLQRELLHGAATAPSAAAAVPASSSGDAASVVASAVSQPRSVQGSDHRLAAGARVQVTTAASTMRMLCDVTRAIVPPQAVLGALGTVEAVDLASGTAAVRVDGGRGTHVLPTGTLVWPGSGGGSSASPPLSSLPPAGVVPQPQPQPQFQPLPQLPLRGRSVENVTVAPPRPPRAQQPQPLPTTVYDDYAYSYADDYCRQQQQQPQPQPQPQQQYCVAPQQQVQCNPCPVLPECYDPCAVRYCDSPSYGYAGGVTDCRY